LSEKYAQAERETVWKRINTVHRCNTFLFLVQFLYFNSPLASACSGRVSFLIVQNTEELGKLSQQIEQVEKREEEIAIEIPENFEKTFRWLENKMKAEIRGEEEAKKMSR